MQEAALSGSDEAVLPRFTDERAEANTKEPEGEVMEEEVVEEEVVEEEVVEEEVVEEDMEEVDEEDMEEEDDENAASTDAEEDEEEDEGVSKDTEPSESLIGTKILVAIDYDSLEDVLEAIERDKEISVLVVNEGRREKLASVIGNRFVIECGEDEKIELDNFVESSLVESYRNEVDCKLDVFILPASGPKGEFVPLRIQQISREWEMDHAYRLSLLIRRSVIAPVDSVKQLYEKLRDNDPTMENSKLMVAFNRRCQAYDECKGKDGLSIQSWADRWWVAIESMCELIGLDPKTLDDDWCDEICEMFPKFDQTPDRILFELNKCLRYPNALRILKTEFRNQKARLRDLLRKVAPDFVSEEDILFGEFVFVLLECFYEMPQLDFLPKNLLQQFDLEDGIAWTIHTYIQEPGSHGRQTSVEKARMFVKSICNDGLDAKGLKAWSRQDPSKIALMLNTGREEPHVWAILFNMLTHLWEGKDFFQSYTYEENNAIVGRYCDMKEFATSQRIFWGLLCNDLKTSDLSCIANDLPKLLDPQTEQLANEGLRVMWREISPTLKFAPDTLHSVWWALLRQASHTYHRVNLVDMRPEEIDYISRLFSFDCSINDEDNVLRRFLQARIEGALGKWDALKRLFGSLNGRDYEHVKLVCERIMPFVDVFLDEDEKKIPACGAMLQHRLIVLSVVLQESLRGIEDFRYGVDKFISPMFIDRVSGHMLALKTNPASFDLTATFVLNAISDKIHLYAEPRLIEFLSRSPKRSFLLLNEIVHRLDETGLITREGSRMEWKNRPSEGFKKEKLKYLDSVVAYYEKMGAKEESLKHLRTVVEGLKGSSLSPVRAAAPSSHLPPSPAKRDRGKASAVVSEKRSPAKRDREKAPSARVGESLSSSFSSSLSPPRLDAEKRVTDGRFELEGTRVVFVFTDGMAFDEILDQMGELPKNVHVHIFSGREEASREQAELLGRELHSKNVKNSIHSSVHALTFEAACLERIRADPKVCTVIVNPASRFAFIEDRLLLTQVHAKREKKPSKKPSAPDVPRVIEYLEHCMFSQKVVDLDDYAMILPGDPLHSHPMFEGHPPNLKEEWKVKSFPDVALGCLQHWNDTLNTRDLDELLHTTEFVPENVWDLIRRSKFQRCDLLSKYNTQQQLIELAVQVRATQDDDECFQRLGCRLCLTKAHASFLLSRTFVRLCIYIGHQNGMKLHVCKEEFDKYVQEMEEKEIHFLKKGCRGFLSLPIWLKTLSTGNEFLSKEWEEKWNDNFLADTLRQEHVSRCERLQIDYMRPCTSLSQKYRYALSYVGEMCRTCGEYVNGMGEFFPLLGGLLKSIHEEWVKGSLESGVIESLLQEGRAFLKENGEIIRKWEGFQPWMERFLEQGSDVNEGKHESEVEMFRAWARKNNFVIGISPVLHDQLLRVIHVSFLKSAGSGSESPLLRTIYDSIEFDIFCRAFGITEKHLVSYAMVLKETRCVIGEEDYALFRGAFEAALLQAILEDGLSVSVQSWSQFVSGGAQKNALLDTMRLLHLVQR